MGLTEDRNNRDRICSGRLILIGIPPIDNDDKGGGERSEELKSRVNIGGGGKGEEGRETKYKKVKRDKVERPKHIKKDTRGDRDADDRVREKERYGVGDNKGRAFFYVTQTW